MIEAKLITDAGCLAPKTYGCHDFYRLLEYFKRLRADIIEITGSKIVVYFVGGHRIIAKVESFDVACEVCKPVITSKGMVEVNSTKKTRAYRSIVN